MYHVHTYCKMGPNWGGDAFYQNHSGRGLRVSGLKQFLPLIRAQEDYRRKKLMSYFCPLQRCFSAPNSQKNSKKSSENEAGQWTFFISHRRGKFYRPPEKTVQEMTVADGLSPSHHPPHLKVCIQKSLHGSTFLMYFANAMLLSRSLKYQKVHSKRLILPCILDNKLNEYLMR